MSDSYADGIGADRCTHCGAVLRHGGEPMVMIRRKDAEAFAGLLSFLRCAGASDFWEAPLQRLEQAVGRPVRLLDAEKGNG